MTLRSSSSTSTPPDVPAKPRRRWYRYLLAKLVLLLLVLAVVASVGSTPWAFRIGGGFTPLGQWHGYGPVRASNGGRYELYAQFQSGLLVFGGPDRPGCSLEHTCDTLHGHGELCAANGSVYQFQLDGRIHAWRSTNGARTMIKVSGGSPRPLPDIISFTGSWHGPVLRLTNADNAFTRALTPGGMMRRKLWVADKGTATATLRAGSASGFAAACRSLAG